MSDNKPQKSFEEMLLENGLQSEEISFFLLNEELASQAAIALRSLIVAYNVKEMAKKGKLQAP